MSELKYKVDDKVRIKNIDWYNKNKDADNVVHCGNKVFDNYMSVFCGSVVTIEAVSYNGYSIQGDMQCRAWTDEMIEGLVEEETKPNIIEEAKIYWDSIKDAWIYPEGYIFKDENGNVINATKIVLEKKKKEYPKTYEECAKIMNCPIAGPSGWLFNFDANIKDPYYRKIDILMGKFTRLLICRDAYWKIAGDEMELEKPWEPDWENPDHDSYPTITRCGGKIIKTTIYTHDCPFAFPTPEMRDAFKENFDPDIEICKEFL